jgi:hypothetical protein
MDVRFFTISIFWIILVLQSCQKKENAFEILLNAQGDSQSFLNSDSLEYNLYYTRYTPNHEIEDTIFRNIRIQSKQVKSDFSCHPDSIFTSSTYALFPFSLTPLNPLATFIKRDTFENQVYHIYATNYSCQHNQLIKHTIYCSYLNNQIRSHLLKMGNTYYRIDVITWQKEGDILFPLRNKIYLSDSLASRKFLWADLIYSNINFK